MQKLLNIITFWLLSIAAFCSCTSVGDPYLTDTDGTGTIIITGTVSEAAVNTPIEGIKLIFEAYKPASHSNEPITAINAYTDSQGTFSITAEGFTSAVTGIITTDHPDYKNVSKQVMITWKGTSYDPETRTFFVNNCDFHIEKNK